MMLVHSLTEELRVCLRREPERRRTVLMHTKYGGEYVARSLVFPHLLFAWVERRRRAGWNGFGDWGCYQALRVFGSQVPIGGLDEATLHPPKIPSVHYGVVCMPGARGCADPVTLFWNSSFENGAWNTIVTGQERVPIFDESLQRPYSPRQIAWDIASNAFTMLGVGYPQRDILLIDWRGEEL